MNRAGQIAALCDYIKEHYGIDCGTLFGRAENGEGTVIDTNRNLAREEKCRLMALLSCNRKDMSRFYGGDPDLGKEPPVYRVDKKYREHNGCLSGAGCVFTGCICEGGCFPDMRAKCPMCDAGGYYRRCLVMDPAGILRRELPSRDWEAWYAAREPSLAEAWRRITGRQAERRAGGGAMLVSPTPMQRQG